MASHELFVGYSPSSINEGAVPDVVRYIRGNMSKLVTYRGDYQHVEGNSDAHITSSLFGCEQMVIVEDGQVMLCTWQKVYFSSSTGRDHASWG